VSDVGLTTRLQQFLTDVQGQSNHCLDLVLPDEETHPAVVHRAMRYSVFAGGKRFRPALVIAAGRVFGAPQETLLNLACGIELIHTYSLIHDDLPCMDDDDLRRGKPTLHKVFGEGVAVLAGDALYALAFEIISRCSDPQVVAEVARATGTMGMIGGQVVDILLEGQPIRPEDLEYIHEHKTGSIITACVTAGARLGDAEPGEVEAIDRYGRNVGLAFQIVDDVLDEVGDAATLGKEPGSDRIKDKNTYPKLHGLEGSVQIATELVERAKNELVLPGRDTIILRLLADFVVQRVT
jgi:geranylgeranyl diphosphate synthase type II